MSEAAPLIGREIADLQGGACVRQSDAIIMVSSVRIDG